MVFVVKDDFYSVMVDSIITNFDESVVLNLYQPLIGIKAAGLFLGLLEEFNNETIRREENRKHEILLNKTQLTSGEFLTCRHYLEALGLVSTFLKTGEDGNNIYIYLLHAPKSPKHFFEDPLFKSLLIKYVGLEEADALAKKYQIKVDVKGYENISASFGDIFKMDTANLSNDPNLNPKVLGRLEGQIKDDFDLKEFYKIINDNGCNCDSVLGDKEVKKIISLGIANQLNEVVMGELVLECLDLAKPLGKKLDLDMLNNKCLTHSHFSPMGIKKPTEKVEIKVSSETMNAKKLQLFQNISPEQYIQILQDNIPPSYSDKSVINYLRMEQNLEDDVINVIVDYCLNFKTKPCFNIKYVSAVASSLIKNKKHKSTIDALSYFYQSDRKKGKDKSNNSNTTNTKKTQKIGEGGKQFVSRFSKEEGDALLAELENDIYGRDKK